MKKIRIGVIGCNYMGKMHAECYKLLEGVELAAVADLHEEVARELASGTDAAVYTDAKKMIEEVELDAVDICLPTFLHAEYALLAMDRVKYVFIEKPVCLTKEEGKALLEKQQQTGAQVQIGQVMRFWSEYKYLKEVTDNGDFGNLVSLTMRRLSPSPSWGKGSWQKNTKLSGGALLDLHIHDIDFMLYLLGSPKDCKCIKNIQGETNSFVSTLCTYENTVVSVDGTWNLPVTYPFNMYFRAVFETAVVEFNGDGITVFEADRSYAPEYEKNDIKSGYKGGNISSLGGYYNELKYFTDKIKENEPIALATLSDGVQSLNFIIDYLY